MPLQVTTLIGHPRDWLYYTKPELILHGKLANEYIQYVCIYY